MYELLLLRSDGWDNAAFGYVEDNRFETVEDAREGITQLRYVDALQPGDVVAIAVVNDDGVLGDDIVEEVTIED